MKGERGQEILKGKKIAVLRGEDCSFCRGGPTATYRLHTCECWSARLYVHTCKDMQACLMPGLVLSVCACVFS